MLQVPFSLLHFKHFMQRGRQRNDPWLAILRCPGFGLDPDPDV
jgi:hypothetical protein